MSTKISVAGFISTNVNPQSVHKGFLNQCSAVLSQCFHTTDEHITLEMTFNPHMLRAGSTAPMMNVQLFHNSDLVDVDSKHKYARQLAQWVAKTIRVPEDRVLVLFVDTRFTVFG